MPGLAPAWAKEKYAVGLKPVGVDALEYLPQASGFVSGRGFRFTPAASRRGLVRGRAASERVALARGWCAASQWTCRAACESSLGFVWLTLGRCRAACRRVGVGALEYPAASKRLQLLGRQIGVDPSS